MNTFTNQWRRRRVKELGLCMRLPSLTGLPLRKLTGRCRDRCSSTRQSRAPKCKSNFSASTALENSPTSRSSTRTSFSLSWLLLGKTQQSRLKSWWKSSEKFTKSRKKKVSAKSLEKGSSESCSSLSSMITLPWIACTESELNCSKSMALSSTPRPSSKPDSCQWISRQVFSCWKRAWSEETSSATSNPSQKKREEGTPK